MNYSTGSIYTYSFEILVAPLLRLRDLLLLCNHRHVPGLYDTPLHETPETVLKQVTLWFETA